jgi:hypothetical protein
MEVRECKELASDATFPRERHAAAHRIIAIFREPEVQRGIRDV